MKLDSTTSNKTNNFDGPAFALKAHHGTAAEENVIDLVNTFSGVWSLRCDGSVVATDLIFDDGAFHTLIVHYKSSEPTLDAYLDGTIVAADFSAAHGDYAVDYIELFNNRLYGSRDFFHGIEIGQLAPYYDGVCGDTYHVPPVGDINLDCVVDFADFALMAENAGEPVLP